MYCRGLPLLDALVPEMGGRGGVCRDAEMLGGAARAESRKASP